MTKEKKGGDPGGHRSEALELRRPLQSGRRAERRRRGPRVCLTRASHPRRTTTSRDSKPRRRPESVGDIRTAVSPERAPNEQMRNVLTVVRREQMPAKTRQCRLAPSGTANPRPTGTTTWGRTDGSTAQMSLAVVDRGPTGGQAAAPQNAGGGGSVGPQEAETPRPPTSTASSFTTAGKRRRCKRASSDGHHEPPVRTTGQRPALGSSEAGTRHNTEGPETGQVGAGHERSRPEGSVYIKCREQAKKKKGLAGRAGGRGSGTRSPQRASLGA